MLERWLLAVSLRTHTLITFYFSSVCLGCNTSFSVFKAGASLSMCLLPDETFDLWSAGIISSAAPPVFSHCVENTNRLTLHHSSAFWGKRLKIVFGFILYYLNQHIWIRRRLVRWEHSHHVFFWSFSTHLFKLHSFTVKQGGCQEEKSCPVFLSGDSSVFGAGT